MQISVQVVVQTEGDEPASVTEIAHFERVGFDAGSLGLHLDEAKSLLGRLQRSMIHARATEAIPRLSVCPKCSSQLARNRERSKPWGFSVGILGFPCHGRGNSMSDDTEWTLTIFGGFVRGRRNQKALSTCRH